MIRGQAVMVYSEDCVQKIKTSLKELKRIYHCVMLWAWVKLSDLNQIIIDASLYYAYIRIDLRFSQIEGESSLSTTYKQW